ncbi:MAG: recombinase RecA, partial [Mariprofundaceae bacterium]
TRVKVFKNKVSPPFKQANFSIMYGEGISHAGEVLDMGVEHGLINKSGAWYATKDKVRIGQGRENAIQYLKEHPELMAEVEAALRERLGLKPADAAAEGAA